MTSCHQCTEHQTETENILDAHKLPIDALASQGVDRIQYKSYDKESGRPLYDIDITFKTNNPCLYCTTMFDRKETLEEHKKIKGNFCEPHGQCYQKICPRCSEATGSTGRDVEEREE